MPPGFARLTQFAAACQSLRLGMSERSGRSQLDTSTDRGRTTMVDEGGPGGPGEEERLYFAVFEQERSSMFELPRNGRVTIGRSESAELHLEDSGASREHAELSLAEGEARLSDLDSRNGTFVNGERVVGARVLMSGDAVSIGSTSLVYHTSVRQPPPRALLELEELRRTATEELERSLAYQRPLSVAVLGGRIAKSDRWSIANAVERALRRVDRMAWGAAGQLYLLLPEAGPRQAESIARRVLTLARARGHTVRVGFASCPQEGRDVATLLASARSALAAVHEGQVGAAGRAFRTVEIGERSAVVADEAMLRLFELVRRLAAGHLPVLVTGETGTGKDLVAAAVHHFSARAAGPLVTVNCAALQETLIESELFGHEEGAFSGAVATKLGRMEAAHGGTVLLDEVGELAPSVQAKLLRALETGRFTRVGGVEERQVDVRLVAATNRDLRQASERGEFRMDLYYRLGAATVWIPPLRDRRREIPLLAQLFLAEACAPAERPPMTISDGAMHRLMDHEWRGNVRELLHTMQYLATATRGTEVEDRHVADCLRMSEQGVAAPPIPASPTAEPQHERPRADASSSDEPAIPATFRPIKQEVRELERKRMQEALAAAHGNRTRAAALIEMPLRTFVTKFRLYGLGEDLDPTDPLS